LTKEKRLDLSMDEDLLANIETTPREVSERIERGDKFLLVDVREQWEYETAHIEGSVLVPLREVPMYLEHLIAAGDVVCMCHHGVRSMDAAAWLRSKGVAGARSMAGGIDRWTTEVDPLVPRY
jgi:rhodanese-related sulfurtransferase